MVISIPITNRACEAVVPVKRKEQHGSVIVMRQNVNDRMQHAGAKEKAKPTAELQPDSFEHDR